MKLIFKHLTIHNFLSYGHSEIDLDNKGYCMVNGRNNCSKDHALSNGSGKSTWVSSICWCLTGETIQGITKDIKNIYIDEDLCYVSLEFYVDSTKYIVTRYNKPKSDLKISVNDEDKSGKGIKESELILAKYLPDLTKNLISSVILLGQGLPNKLSSHTPSGRKEMLEQLSKSDFMIEDIKKRITSRMSSLNTESRSISDSILSENTTISVLQNQLKNSQTELDNYITTKNNTNFETEIASTQNDIKTSEDLIVSLNSSVDKISDEYDSISKKLVELNDEMHNELTDELSCYNNKHNSLMKEQSDLNASINSLSKEITRLKSIKDICPTCGQRIPNVVKPDTAKQEEELKSLVVNLTDVKNNINSCDKKHQEYKQNISNDFNEQMRVLRNTYNTDASRLKELKDAIKAETSKKNSNELRLNKLQNDKNIIDDNINRVTKDINKYTKEIESHNTIKEEWLNRSTSLNQHIEVIKKMDTLVKRDFRGYLLSNIIEFIDKKAKEYCNEVFGSDNIEFKLEGNNIDISYCDKPFESLSGGEKQKVDLILQFSIRDFMSKYLNFSSNILCLDEIFDNLDSISTTSALNLISNKLNDVESLFIISHHSDELSIPYDCTMNIVKNEQGISEVI